MSSHVPDEFPPDFDFGALLEDIGNAEARDHEAINAEPAPVAEPKPAPTSDRSAA